MNICIHHISSILKSYQGGNTAVLTLATRVIPLLFMTEQLQMKHDVTLCLIGKRMKMVCVKYFWKNEMAF